MICEVDFFIEKWNQMSQYRQQIEHLLAPARETLKSTLRSPTNLLWELSDLQVIQKGGQGYDILFIGSYYSRGETENVTWQIPLEICLSGKEAILNFFADEKKERERKAREAGERKEMHDRDERYRRFLLLKNEFEPTIGVGLVKV